MSDCQYNFLIVLLYVCLFPHLSETSLLWTVCPCFSSKIVLRLVWIGDEANVWCATMLCWAGYKSSIRRAGGETRKIPISGMLHGVNLRFIFYRILLNTYYFNQQTKEFIWISLCIYCSYTSFILTYLFYIYCGRMPFKCYPGGGGCNHGPLPRRLKCPL